MIRLNSLQLCTRLSGVRILCQQSTTIVCRHFSNKPDNLYKKKRDENCSNNAKKKLNIASIREEGGFVSRHVGLSNLEVCSMVESLNFQVKILYLI